MTRSSRAWLSSLTLLLALAAPRIAEAQNPPLPTTPRQTPIKSPATGKEMELDIGGVFLPPVPMGEQSINLTAPNGSPLPLAKTSSRTAASSGLDARFGFRASPRWRIEVNGGWSHVRFQTKVTDDTEAASVTSAIGVSRLTAGGAAAFRLAQRKKTEYYLIGGASWMREISELSADGVYDDGSIADGGGGMKMLWSERDKAKIKRIGLRVEGRVGIRTGGLSLDAKDVHFVSTVFGGVFFGF